MAAFSSMYDYIFPELPGATHKQIDVELLMAIRDFLRRTHLYKQDITATVTNGVSANLTAPAGYEVYDIVGETTDRWIKFGVTKLYPLDKVDLADAFVDHSTATGTPQGYIVDDQAIRVYPSASGTVVAKALLIPTVTATAFPDFLLRKDVYRDGVAAGAKYRMMIKPRVRWSNPQLAALYRNQFEHAVAVGNVNEFRNSTRKPLRARTMYGIA